MSRQNDKVSGKIMVLLATAILAVFFALAVWFLSLFNMLTAATDTAEASSTAYASITSNPVHIRLTKPDQLPAESAAETVQAIPNETRATEPQSAETQITPGIVTAAANLASDTEAELLARILYAECNTESREGRLMVAQCVIDRIESGHWGTTVSNVVYAPGQFASPGRLTDELLDVAEDALAGEHFNEDYTILYFRRTSGTQAWHAPYLGHIGVHAYYGYEN